MQSGGSSQNREENATWKKLQNMHLPVPIMQEPHSLSISTRGIGLVLAKILPDMTTICTKYDGDDELEYEPNFPVAAIYRASLAQLEAKMYFAKENQSGPFSVRSITESSLFSPPKIFHKSFMFNNRNFSPIALIINSIGHVEVNRKHFEPRFLAKPSPLNIRITNLRKYCVDMSNLETASSDRVAGYELNSIPNAKWEFNDADDPQSVYLANPDEIIPEDYNDESIKRDLNELYKHVSTIVCEKINYKNPGDPGILASTQVVPGESIKLRGTTGEIKNEQFDMEFWSCERIELISWTIGAIGLTGEIFDSTITTQRSKSLAIQKNYVNRSSAINSLIRFYYEDAFDEK